MKVAFLFNLMFDATPLNIMGHAPTLAQYGNLGLKTSGSHELPQCVIVIVIAIIIIIIIIIIVIVILIIIIIIIIIIIKI